MNWTPTPPTEPGLYYWRMDDKHSWEALRIGKFFNQLKVCVADRTLLIHSIGGEWGGRVPAPGTTWNVEEIIKYFTNFMKDGFDIEVALEDIKKERNGIAATTARHRKGSQ